MIIKQENPYTHREYVSSGTELQKEQEIPYLTFRRLSGLDFICHGFSTRLGGVSEGTFASMNLSFSRGDDPEKVTENFRRIAAAVGFDPADLVLTDQVHKTEIHEAGRADCAGADLTQKKLEEIDGLITDVPGLMLGTSYADCVPLFFVDPVKKAIGLSHSGWKGTVGKIGQKTVERMKERYQTDPGDLIAVIGPSVCPSCYEVSREVAEEFQRQFKPEQWAEFLQEKKDGKFQLDLWLACRYSLLEAGLQKENIEICGVCTRCNSGLLWSHRATGGIRGGMMAFLGIRR